MTERADAGNCPRPCSSVTSCIAGCSFNSAGHGREGGDQDSTPDGPTLHSINVDPRDSNHLYFGMSSGGVFENVDRAASWFPLNNGCQADFLPIPDPEYRHDPHCLRLHPLRPGRLYQQNHCGIYRMDRADGRWVRIGERMPKLAGGLGLPVVLRPWDSDTLRMFPMDGAPVWPHVSPGGKPAAYVSRNGGKTWGVKTRAFRNLKFVDRQTSGDERRCSRPGWPVSRSNQRGIWRESDRRPPMAVFDTTFAGSVCRGSWVVVFIVSIPTSLRS